MIHETLELYDVYEYRDGSFFILFYIPELGKSRIYFKAKPLYCNLDLNWLNTPEIARGSLMDQKSIIIKKGSSFKTRLFELVS